MAYLGDNYNDDSAERLVGGGSSDPLPPSSQNPSLTYYARIVKTSTEAVKNDGVQLVLELDVLHPEEFVNRKIFDRITIKTNNEKAKKYIAGAMNDLRKACKLIELNDDEQLHDKIVQVETDIKLGGDTYTNKKGETVTTTPQTRVLKYWPEDHTVTEVFGSNKGDDAQPAQKTFSSASTPAQSAPAQQTAPAKKMPWVKK